MDELAVSPSPGVRTETKSENIDGHQVITQQTFIPDDMRVSKMGMRPISDDEVVVELRLRRITKNDPRWGRVPTTALENFIVG